MAGTTELVYTPLEEIPQIHATLRKSFRAGKLKSIEARKKQILQLAYLLQDNYDRFKEAFIQDLGRPSLEASFLELDVILSDCKIAYDRVDKWARPEKAPFNVNVVALRPVIRKEPKGVILSISPFNYPVWLSLGPIVGALAAGNCCVLKPSELSSAISGLIAELIPKYMDSDVIRVVLGAVPETTKLLELPWDHILYTGSGRVARIISMAAAKTLSPVSLELGGKSPVVIDPKCDLKTAARRILWGKCVNAGQTCVAPDYVLVQEDAQDTVVKALKEAYDEFYPNGAATSPDFSHIINKAHFNRLKGLLDRTAGKIELGGQTDESRLMIAPTIVKNVTGDDSLMGEELFGPILPIVPVKSLDEAIKFINERDHPLALYVFTQDTNFKNKVFDNTRSGSAVANDCLLHCGTDGLPFGGVGPSGHGYQTGKFAFEMFTHMRGSLDSPSWVDKLLGSRYPPYTAKKENWLKTALGVRLPPRPVPAPGDKNVTMNSHRGGGGAKWAILVAGLLMLIIVRRNDAQDFVGWLRGFLNV